jgi:hypothetical protein
MQSDFSKLARTKLNSFIRSLRRSIGSDFEWNSFRLFASKMSRGTLKNFHFLTRVNADFLVKFVCGPTTALNCESKRTTTSTTFHCTIQVWSSGDCSPISILD